MKSDLYFRHDVYTLDDSEVMALVYQYHEAGYGVFWAVVERLTAEQTHRMPIDVLAMQVSVKLMATKPAKVREIISTCVRLGLLVEQDGLVYNERVLRQCERMERYSKTQAENVQKRWDRYRGNSGSDPVESVPDTTQESESRNAERDERKELAQGLVDIYHTMCPSLPRVRILTPARVTHANTFLRDFSMTVIEEGFSKAEASDFLKHGNGTWKGAGFDWLVNKTNFAKVIEGNYDNHQPSHRSSICNDGEVMGRSQNAGGGFDL